MLNFYVNITQYSSEKYFFLSASVNFESSRGYKVFLLNNVITYVILYKT